MKQKKKKKIVPQTNDRIPGNQALQQESSQRDEHQGSLPAIRYSGPFLKWARKELRQMDQRTRKVMTIHKALQSSDDKDYMCQEKKDKEDSPAVKIV